MAFELETIKKRIVALEKEQEESQKIKEMLKNELESNDQYCVLMEERKRLNDEIKQVKDEILQKFQSTIKELEEKKEEIDTLNEILDSELLLFWHENPIENSNIKTENGIRHVMIKSKAVKTNQQSLFGAK